MQQELVRDGLPVGGPTVIALALSAVLLLAVGLGAFLILGVHLLQENLLAVELHPLFPAKGWLPSPVLLTLLDAPGSPKP